ncbi:MAG TPA: hypothetical protein PLJ99_00175 [Kiritimatiellia bacterium]|nr:hypothetical protein [Kiritimatiellia bacterium]HPJ57415.1 hypothetical protein [Kiritimatiellia bacterium]HPR67685.1 hypothetical protein [Kiritimatiellia bacterium]HRX06788.1 hypothetical protein [Kiritimatiellia bacterium]
MPWMLILVLMAGSLCFAGLAVRAQAQGDRRPEFGQRVFPDPEDKSQRADWERYSMCTRMALPRGSPEYRCPVCGEKTAYAEPERWRLGRLETMQHQLASFKEQNRSGYGFELDARAFCRNCTPEPAGEPDVVLRATAPDGREQVTRGLSMEDIQLLRRFAGNPEMEPTPRLRALLGLAPEEE